LPSERLLLKKQKLIEKLKKLLKEKQLYNTKLLKLEVKNQKFQHSYFQRKLSQSHMFHLQKNLPRRANSKKRLTNY